METGMVELAVVVVIAALLGALARVLRQPVVIAYLLTGVALGFGVEFGYINGLGIAGETTFELFADLGIMFLLFLVGLEVNYASLRLVGKSAATVGLLQVFVTTIIGFILARFLGMDVMNASYLAIALTFSSTVIVVKLLSERHEMNSLYGRIALGTLLTQDVVAMILLIVLSGLGSAGLSEFPARLIEVVGPGVLFFVLMVGLGIGILPKLFDQLGRSQELLFISSLAWVFTVSALVSRFGFSVEIGGFLAGIALANVSERYEIATRVRSLRDFFILVFFAILGSSLVFAELSGLVLPIVVFSLFVLIGNPLIILVIMGVLGYRSRTGFRTGIALAQISEFSFVLVALGYRLGHVNSETVAVATAVGVITIIISTYYIEYGDFLYPKLHHILKRFERAHPFRERKAERSRVARPILLVGFQRTGQSIAMYLEKKDIVVVEHDPDMIAILEREGYAYVFGDAGDEETYVDIDFSALRLAINTSPTTNDNLAFLEIMRKEQRNRATTIGKKLSVVLRAETDEDAVRYYEHGADYVLLPHFTSGQFLGCVIASDLELRPLETTKRRERSMLMRRPEDSVALVCDGPFFEPELFIRDKKL